MIENEELGEEETKTDISCQSTSPCNLYAEMKNTLKIWGVLKLQSRSQGVEVCLKLAGILVMDTLHSQA